MPVYLGFLRAINLGATRQFPKAELRRVVESVGFTEVETHINTGNIRFRTPMRSVPRIERVLEAAFQANRGFEVPTVVFTLTEFDGIAAETTAMDDPLSGELRHYVELLRTAPPADTSTRIELASSDTTRFVVRGRAVHIFMPAHQPPAGPRPVDAARLLGVSTNRNATVIRAIAQRWP